MEIEFSTNLTTWTALEKGSERFVDTSSVKSEWRFYRAKTASGAFAPDVIGFIRVPVEPGARDIFNSDIARLCSRLIDAFENVAPDRSWKNV